MDVSSTALSAYLKEDLIEAVGHDGFSIVSDYFPGATVQDVYCSRLWHSFMKKNHDEVKPDADDRCLEKFLQSNSRCKNWRLELQSVWDEILVGTFQKVLDDFFYPDGEPLVQSYFDFMNRGRCGPGASLGANGVDFYTKLFSSELTATSSFVYDVYAEYCAWFPDWRDAELIRHLTFGGPRITSSSSLTFVRKTRDVSRSICTEPSLNMFMQLGFGEILASRLNRFFGIDLSSQPEVNRKLAQIGSLEDSFITIDLESASDSISCGFVDTFFPEYIKDILSVLRTPRTRTNGKELVLNMVSTMGNGFTFPLQTLIFSCVVRAATLCRGRKPTSSGGDNPDWAVFGDDIICDRTIARDVCRLLQLFGFVVNGTKSYFVGPFRESCGADFYMGVNVRGVYIKSLVSQQSRYVAINLLNEWSTRSGIPLTRTVGYLVDSVRYLAIPPWENLDAGIRSPRPFGRCWHRGKQRYLYRCYYPVIRFLKVEDIESNARVPRKRRKSRFYNPPGLWFSFLGGYIRNMKIPLSLKQGESPSYRMRMKVSPFWGPSSEQLSVADGWHFWRRWNSATSVNLSLES